MPTRYDRPVGTGRTEPLRITVVTDDDIEHDVVLKVSAGQECSVETLMNEMLGSILAADLALPINEPFFVRLDTDFIQSLNNDAIKTRLQSSCPLAFASKHAGNQWHNWMSSDKLSASQLNLALSVMAFDAFIGNSDRSPIKSNLLVNGDDWRLIDHEAAFQFRMLLSFLKCEPWKLGNLERMRRTGERSEHLFASQLSGKSNLDFDDIHEKWAGLSDTRLAQHDALLPEEWEDIRPALADAINHLKMVRDNIAACLEELKRVLS